MHGGGAAPAGAGVGALGVRVLRLQMLMQRLVHCAETRTLHVVKKTR